MGKFRKEGKKEVPQVSTSSLPDIVYMLIFFFMITTSMRDVELKVKTAMPKASEIHNSTMPSPVRPTSPTGFKKSATRAVRPTDRC